MIVRSRRQTYFLIMALMVTAVLAAGCTNTPPEETLSFWIDDAEKNRRARDLVRSIRDERFASILSVSHIGPSQYKLQEVVEEFGRRAAVRYDSDSYDFIILFDVKVERGIGPWRDINVTTTLIRSVSEQNGSEPFFIAKEYGSCSVDPKNQIRPCKGHVERLAESTLYSFIHP